jgi:lipopolysaccharide transport system permease protein
VRDLWRARDLVGFLALRDLKLRYKQTALGIVWAVLPPLLAMVLFSAVFGRVLGKEADGIPYPLLCLAALVPWQVFSVALVQSSLSLSSNQQLVTKVWFPRLVLPMSAALSPIVDALISGTILVGAILWSGLPVPSTILLLPVLAILPVFAALSFSLWLSALNAHFRDVRNILPFLVQGWMFATPVVYPMSILGPSMKRLVALNPMTPVVELFRWAALGTPAPTNLLPSLGAGAACWPPA